LAPPSHPRISEILQKSNNYERLFNDFCENSGKSFHIVSKQTNLDGSIWKFVFLCEESFRKFYLLATSIAF
jgi:hypothetical protein